MSRAAASRLRKIEGRFGWQMTPILGRDGGTHTFRTLPLVDAWLRVQLDGDVPNLPPAVSHFIARSQMRRGDGELLLGLREACRDIWFPDRKRTQAEQDEIDLQPDPPPPSRAEDEPTPSPTPTRQRGIRPVGGHV